MEPSYLKKRLMKDAYDLGCVFPKIENCLGRSTVNILQKWPHWNSSLDESQMEAVKHGLTKRLAIIQGPPGTGKTYVGLTIARILLSNIQCGPILVICYILIILWHIHRDQIKSKEKFRRRENIL